MDPEIHVRVRTELRAAIQAYYDAHTDLVRNLQGVPRQGFVEVRMNALTCGLPPVADSILSNERLARAGNSTDTFQWWAEGSGDISQFQQYLGRPGVLRDSVRYQGAWPGPPYKALRNSTNVLLLNRLVLDRTPAELAAVARRLSKATVYPMISFAAWGGHGQSLRNFTGAKDDNTKHEPFGVTCSTSMDMIPKSPFLQLTKEARFAMTPEEIAGQAALEVIDSRDIEHLALHPAPEQISKKDAFIEGLEDSLTLGLKVAWDEAFTEGGSPAKKILHPAKQEVPPRGHDVLLDLKKLFSEGCFFPTSGCPTEADIVASAGRWRPGPVLHLAAPDRNCVDCVDYVLRFSVRYLQ